MAQNTKIEWCDHTFNPWIGCSRISPGCINCYAEILMDKRYGTVEWGPGKPRKRTAENNWKLPIRWNRKAERENVRYKVFCASLADVFDQEVIQAWREDLWALVARTPFLDWLLLTKRPQNISAMVPACWLDGEWPANVWLGTTVENQSAVQRLAIIRQFPAPVRFASCEPMVGPVDLRNGANENMYSEPTSFDAHGKGIEWTDPGDSFIGIDWVICGGESGDDNDIRPMHPAWARNLRDQCKDASVPFLFKQWGEFIPSTRRDVNKTHATFVAIRHSGQIIPLEKSFDHVIGDCMMLRAGRSNTGRLLDGVEHNEYPTPQARQGNLYKHPEPPEPPLSLDAFWGSAGYADGCAPGPDTSDYEDEE